MGELDGTGVARPVGGREHVPCLPGHDDGATGMRWHGRDTRRARGCWAAPGGVARGLGPLLAWRGAGEVQRGCVLEGELGSPFYRWSEAVAENGVLRRSLRRRRALVREV